MIDILEKLKFIVNNPQTAQRMSVCVECPSFIESTTTCKECGCFMRAKVFVPNAECPLGKW